MRPLGETEKVFGIGLSKTGTLSLAKALDTLGIPSIHFPHDEQTLAELQRGEYRLSVMNRYRGVTDTPVAPFYAQLDRAWPGSKFILTIREKDSWLESVRDHWRVLKRDGKRANDVDFQRYVDFINACVYGCIYFNADRFSFAYDAHVNAVRDYFRDRPSDFLVLDICGGAGWSELCAFLGVDTPAGVEFPHAHQNPWLRVALATRKDISTTIPVGEALILIDQEGLREYLGSDRLVLPFVERNNQFWGLPRDDEEAIREIERLRADRKARFLAVASPSLWILQHYGRFAHHLRSRYQLLLENDYLVVFDLA